jgi:TRAP-type C4-dicarboxylate transport system permease small subunit
VISILEATGRVLEKVLTHVLAGLLFAMILLDVALVALRYLFGVGFPWSGEVGILLLMSLCWLGLPLLWLKQGHILLDLFSGLASSRLSVIAAVALQLVFLVSIVALTVFAWQTMEQFSFIDMASLPVAQSVKFMPMIAGAILSVLAALCRLAEIASCPPQETAA